MSKLIKVSEVDEDYSGQQNFVAFAVDDKGDKTTLFFSTAKAAVEWGTDFIMLNRNISNVNVYGIELWCAIERDETKDE